MRDARHHTVERNHWFCEHRQFLLKYVFLRKMFHIKVVGYQGGHMMLTFIWPYDDLEKRYQGQHKNLKCNSLFFIAYSCSLARDLFKTLLSSFSISSFRVMKLENYSTAAHKTQPLIPSTMSRPVHFPHTFPKLKIEREHVGLLRLKFCAQVLQCV